MQTTNALRLLEAAGIDCRALPYPVDDDPDSTAVADRLGLPHEQVFKTLVLTGERTGVFVCCIPICETIDLRKAAQAAGDKRVQLLPLKDLLPATGYVRGGCSPIGMRKRYPLYIDETCMLHDSIAVNAGMRGLMLLIAPGALVAYANAAIADLTRV